MNWIDTIVQGVLLGGLYALFAAGLSLVFGIMRLVNLAHGDLIVLGAYLILLIVSLLGLSFPVFFLGILLIMIFSIQLGWFPDYSDADNYLSPFFATENFLANNYSNDAVDELIAQQRSEEDPAERQRMIEEVQALVAQDLSTIPFLQGAQIAITGTDVEGATLDGSFKFRYGSLVKG